MLEWRRFAPALVLAMGCALLAMNRGQRALPLAAPLDSLLQPIEGYRVQSQQISKEERAVAGMSDYAMRSYWRDSLLAFTTYVGYYESQAQGKTIHSPRNCLPGAGWEIQSGGYHAVTSGGTRYVVNRYVLRNGTAQALVYYWYQGRGRIVANEYVVKWNLLRDAELLGHSEEALVRVFVPVRLQSNPVAGGVPPPESVYASADAVGEEVASRLIGDVRSVLPRLQ